MKFLDPAKFDTQPLVLCALFPFLLGSDDSPLARAKAIARLAILIHGRCTVPGSLVLKDPVLFAMIREDVDFISEGVLMPCLRSSFDSYSQYVDDYSGPLNREDLYARASFLDQHCPAVMRFDPHDLSGRFRDALRGHAEGLHNAASDNETKDALHSYMERLQLIPDIYTLEHAEANRTGLSSIDKSLLAGAKMLYAILGARSLNSVAQIPARLVEDAFPASAVAQEEEHFLLEHSIRHVFDCLSLNVSHLHLVPTDALLKLRDEGATHQALEKIRTVVRSVAADAHLAAEDKETTEALREVERGLDEALRKELKRIPAVSAGATIAEETISIASENLPGVGLIRRGVTKLGCVIARKTKLKRLDVTPAPIYTFADRLRSGMIQAKSRSRKP